MPGFREEGLRFGVQTFVYRILVLGFGRGKHGLPSLLLCLGLLVSGFGFPLSGDRVGRPLVGCK